MRRAWDAERGTRGFGPVSHGAPQPWGAAGQRGQPRIAPHQKNVAQRKNNKTLPKSSKRDEKALEGAGLCGMAREGAGSRRAARVRVKQRGSAGKRGKARRGLGNAREDLRRFKNTRESARAQMKTRCGASTHKKPWPETLREGGARRDEVGRESARARHARAPRRAAMCAATRHSAREVAFGSPDLPCAPAPRHAATTWGSAPKSEA